MFLFFFKKTQYFAQDINLNVDGDANAILDRAPQFDEHGNYIELDQRDNGIVWTGYNKENCSNWQSVDVDGRAGDISRTDKNWLRGARDSCRSSKRIYCLQTEKYEVPATYEEYDADHQCRVLYVSKMEHNPAFGGDFFVVLF